MTFDDFVGRVIDDGLEACRADYAGDDQRPRLEGSVAGFEACRGLGPLRLARLLARAREAAVAARAAAQDRENVLFSVCYEAEVEWVCNVVSAALASAGAPVIVPPTARGALKAADILGVAKHDDGRGTVETYEQFASALEDRPDGDSPLYWAAKHPDRTPSNTATWSGWLLRWLAERGGRTRG